MHQDTVLFQMITELGKGIEEAQSEVDEAKKRIAKARQTINTIAQSTLDKFPLL